MNRSKRSALRAPDGREPLARARIALFGTRKQAGKRVTDAFAR